MRAFIARRLLQLVPLLLGISALTFLLLQLAPGDFLATMAENPQVPAEALEQMRRGFGLDQPWYVQYGLYLRNVFLHFDFGYSFAYRLPVFSVLGKGVLNTLLLASAAMVVTWGLAIPFGVLAAVRQHRWQDRTLSVAAFVSLSVPELLSGMLLLMLAANTGWFPVGNMHSDDAADLGAIARALDVARHLVLPALVVGLVPFASRMRQMRASLLDVLKLDYVTTARAKGLSESRVVTHHALRNALNPMITLFGFTLGSLLSGSFVAETIFSWPGIGTITLEAIRTEDQYLVMGAVLVAATVLVLGNLAADLLLAAADPRISHD
ncbi:MAG: ABC transporter permease [Candidatus Eisenbacteria bacterium]|nr:ABC transporter permease [Candidatus Eisenbacteria bacterium]